MQSSSDPSNDALSTTTVLELRNRLREAEETLTAIRDGQVDAVVVRGQAGEQVFTLESADRPYRALIEQMQDGAVTVSTEGAILYCNRRFAALVGARAEHIMGARFSRFFSASTIAVFQRLIGDVDSSNVSGEFSLVRSDMAEVPVAVSLAKIQLDEASAPVICAVVSDLTATRRRSRELQATNDRLAQEIADRHRVEGSLAFALDAAGMGSWDLDLGTDTARCSRRHDEIFGLADSHRQPWGLADVIKPFVSDDKSRVAAAFQNAKRIGEIDLEAQIRRETDGQQRWLRITGRTFYDDQHKPTRIAGVVADITNMRAVEDRLRQAQKIEAIGQLTGGVAHDFNNLLQVISGGLQLISRDVQDPARREKILKGMRQAVDRGSGLSRQLLAFSRLQAINPQPIDLKRQIDGMKELLDRSLRGDVAIQIDLAEGLWPVEVDAGEFELVILNLAVNARDAMPTGGSITIRGANVTDLDEALPGSFVRLDIIDTGSGMPPEVLAHAFEPFFTTKEIGKGSGLGLAQTHGFAGAAGGCVRIDSTLGRGTTISLYLPKTDKVPMPHREPKIDPAAASPSSAHQGEILLVEDDDEVAALTAELITQLGYTSTRVASAHAALGALANGRHIDLVFSDIMMPGTMNGIELAEEIRHRRPGLPVVLTSGFAGAAGRAAGTEHLRILNKPYSLEELRNAFLAARPLAR